MTAASAAIFVFLTIALSVCPLKSRSLAVRPIHLRSTPQTLAMTMKNNRTTDDRESATQKVNASYQSYQVQTLNPLRLLVLRLGFTEPAWVSPLNYGKKDGTFRCAYCGNVLFDSNAKYDSGSGWPSFWRSIREGSISYQMEYDGRLECRCGQCTSHLGHVFLDGPRPSQVSSELLESSPTSDPRGRQADGYLPRFCINGASLRYDERT